MFSSYVTNSQRLQQRMAVLTTMLWRWWPIARFFATCDPLVFLMILPSPWRFQLWCPKKKPILTVLLRGWYTVAYHLVMTNIAMENHHRNRWFTYKKHGDGFHGYVSHNQRVFIQCYPLGVGKIWENGWNPEALRFFLRGHLTCLAVKKRAIRLEGENQQTSGYHP